MSQMLEGLFHFMHFIFAFPKREKRRKEKKKRRGFPVGRHATAAGPSTGTSRLLCVIKIYFKAWYWQYVSGQKKKKKKQNNQILTIMNLKYFSKIMVVSGSQVLSGSSPPRTSLCHIFFISGNIKIYKIQKN
jgi:hypothetical protein